MKKIYVLNGPNLNLLGVREPEIYGTATLADIEAICAKACAEAWGDAAALRFLQSNHEGELIDWIHDARNEACALIINPAAYTHTSIAILDALTLFEGPIVEVHLSQTHKREPFRHRSYVSKRADAVILGMGVHGYRAAIDWIYQQV